MKFEFSISPHEYEPGTVFDDATCYGAYIEIVDEATQEWFRQHGFEGNGYTALALVDSLCRLELKDDEGKYEMEAEADNTWVYGREKAPVDRLLAKFAEISKDEAGVSKLIKNASDELME